MSWDTSIEQTGFLNMLLSFGVLLDEIMVVSCLCTIVYAGNIRDSESMVEIVTDGFFLCSAPRMAGFLVKLFVWILESRIFGMIFLYVLKKDNLIHKVPKLQSLLITRQNHPFSCRVKNASQNYMDIS